MARKRKRSPKINNSVIIPKKQSITLTDRIKVPLSNKFNILDLDTEESNEIQHKQKISPIVVTDINTDINKIITELKLIVETKIVSIGKKIFAKSAEDKEKIIAEFTKNNINFFYHPDSKKIFKAVLTGLPIVETNEIINSLKHTYNVTALKVSMFNTKAASKLYLCHFDKSEINMKTLNTIKVVYSHIIKWQAYKPKQQTLTQCYRCSMYGHGASTCVRYTVCMLCAGEHLTKECTVIKPDTQNAVFKCFNCLSNNLPHSHKANDIQCPFRAKYSATRENMKSKNRKSTSPTNMNNNNNNIYTNNEHRYERAPQPEPMKLSYAAAAALTNTQSKPTHTTKSSSSNQNTFSNVDDNNNLWSFAEVSQIMLQCISELKQCQSKFDQLTVIANMLHHACI